jgi:hypothetical protein
MKKYHLVKWQDICKPKDQGARSDEYEGNEPSPYAEMDLAHSVWG